MDKETRAAIQRATQQARRLLEEDYAAQLEATHDILPSGTVAGTPGAHLDARQRLLRDKIVAATDHKRAAGMRPAEAVADYVRDAAFTTLNRFVALKMLEARELVQECISSGDQSAGYKEYCGLAPGVALLPGGAGYRIYVESIFDELSMGIKVLFDRQDPATAIWPRRIAFDSLLALMNNADISQIWGEDETIGWVYQFFNREDERRALREESQAPRNARELAIRNQFFTPRYVVQFLVDNTLGRTWVEMRQGQTRLPELCRRIVPMHEISSRVPKDPRDIFVLDPACGSGHFLLYSFHVMLAIYEEAWEAAEQPRSTATGKTLREDFPTLHDLRHALPGLVLRHNLHGVDIDARCAQIAQLALWMRAQRAYLDLGIPAAIRPQVNRINVVIAEPVATDRASQGELTKHIEDENVVAIVATLFDSLKLAGHLGVLLKLEDLVSSGPSIGSTGNLFAPAEDQIRKALRDFAAHADTLASTRRRLFAEDATHGLGLLQVTETKFDVVLMNPPFGALTEDGQNYVGHAYPGAHNDVYAAFVRRAHLLCPQGYVGAITSRSFLVTKRLEAFRRKDIIPRIQLLWDLGLGVMDAASVESAAYVLGTTMSPVFHVADGRHGVEAGTIGHLPDNWAVVTRSHVSNLPLAKILYDLPEDARRILAMSRPLEPAVATAREGMKSFENERFVRLFWEVETKDIGTKWLRFAKGGRNLRIFALHPLVLNHENDGAELDERNRQVNGTTAQVRQASSYWLRPGATYSRRAPEFAPRVLPAEYVFSDKGPAVLSTSEVSPAFLLGWLNSRLVRHLVHLQAHKQDYLTGILKKLPWVQPDVRSVAAVEEAVNRALRAWLEVQARSDVSPHYCGPGNARSVKALLLELETIDAAAANALEDCETICDQVIDDVYGANSGGWPRVAEEEEDGGADADEEAADVADATNTSITKVVAWAIGAALGRWRLQETIACGTDGFSAPPTTQPGSLDAESHHGAIVLPDDPGAPNDILTKAIDACALRWGSTAQVVEEEYQEVLGVDGLRHLIRESREPAGLWPYHLRTHTAQRRIAPTLVRIGVASGGYSLWLNWSRVTKDTLHLALQELVDPKIRVEEGRLMELRNSSPAGGRGRASLAAQEEFVLDLRRFRDDLRAASTLVFPSFHDGTMVTLSPLQRLFGFDRQFQAELEKTWAALVSGAYDWSRLAMKLWPERVVPKCHADRSLAIAHGLDAVFWHEATAGQSRPRAMSDDAISKLVQDRLQPGVHTALRSLMENGPPRRERRPRRGG